MLKFLQSLFRPSPADLAFRKCMAAENDLGITVMIFYESFKTAGIDLQPDESSLDELEKILAASDAPEQTLDGLSVYLGCIITETLGGTWRATKDGGYSIIDVGPNKKTIRLQEDIRSPLSGTGRLTPRGVYERIRTQAS